MNTSNRTMTGRIEREANHAREVLTRDIEALEGKAEVASEAIARGGRVAATGAIATGVLGTVAFSMLVGGGRALRGMALGLVAGAGAAWVMTKSQTVWSTIEGKVEEEVERVREGGHEQAPEGSEGGGEEPATVKAAEAVVGPIRESDKEKVGSAVHYAMGAVTGAIYGAMQQSLPFVGLTRGVGFGSLVWLVSDEMVVPLLGLARAPWEYPAKTHLSALFAHVVYGVALDLGIRIGDRVLP